MQFDELKTTGQALATWRKEQKYTQQALGKKIKIDRQTISDIERGQFTGSLAILLRYTHCAGYELGLSHKPSPFPNLDNLGDHYGENDD